MNLGPSDHWLCTLPLDHQDMWKQCLDRYLMESHSAQNNSSATAEIEWRISQKYNDDICLPLCLLFIKCSKLLKKNGMEAVYHSLQAFCMRIAFWVSSSICTFSSSMLPSLIFPMIFSTSHLEQ